MRFFLLFLALSIPAIGANVAGTYQQKFEIVLLGYTDAKSCRTDGGRWADEFCWFPAANEVVIARGSEGLTMSVTTVATNAHECAFSAPASDASGNAVVAERISEEYNEETGKFEPARCIVVARFLDDSVFVRNNGKCRSFCGVRASLVVDNAKRVQ